MSRNARNGENEDWWKFKWDVKRRSVSSIINEKGEFDKNGKSGERGAFGEHLPEGWRKFKWDIKLTRPLLSGEFDENGELILKWTHATAKMALSLAKMFQRTGKNSNEISYDALLVKWRIWQKWQNSNNFSTRTYRSRKKIGVETNL